MPKIGKAAENDRTTTEIMKNICEIGKDILKVWFNNTWRLGNMTKIAKITDELHYWVPP